MKNLNQVAGGRGGRKGAEQGFTLLELAIVIFIMLMMTMLMLYNFRQGDIQKRVALSRDAVITALRTAQNYSLAGKQIPATASCQRNCGGSACTNKSAKSFWVEFSGGNMDIMADMADSTCSHVMRVERMPLVANTRFPTSNPFSVTTTQGTTNSANLAVKFTPPFATMKVASAASPTSANFSDFSSASITVEFNDGSRPRTIVVDGISGKID